MYRIAKKILGPILKRDERELRDISSPIIVVGMQRSGTSLVCQMLASAGVYFGEEEDLRVSDSMNPQGFYEHKDIFTFSRNFIKEAGFRHEMSIQSISFRPKTFLSRVKRFLTRRHMVRIIKKIGARQGVWGFKNFPIFLYGWKKYVNEPTLICVYRNPYAVLNSFMRAWDGGFFRADDVFSVWVRSNRDLLYHHAFTKNSCIISYDDLVDPLKRVRIMEHVSEMTGFKVEDLEKPIDTALNRSHKRVSSMQDKLSLPESVTQVWDELEKMKMQ